MNAATNIFKLDRLLSGNIAAVFEQLPVFMRRGPLTPPLLRQIMKICSDIHDNAYHLGEKIGESLHSADGKSITDKLPYVYHALIGDKRDVLSQMGNIEIIASPNLLVYSACRMPVAWDFDRIHHELDQNNRPALDCESANFQDGMGLCLLISDLLEKHLPKQNSWRNIALPYGNDGLLRGYAIHKPPGTASAHKILNAFRKPGKILNPKEIESEWTPTVLLVFTEYHPVATEGPDRLIHDVLSDIINHPGFHSVAEHVIQSFVWGKTYKNPYGILTKESTQSELDENRQTYSRAVGEEVTALNKQDTVQNVYLYQNEIIKLTEEFLSDPHYTHRIGTLGQRILPHDCIMA